MGSFLYPITLIGPAGEATVDAVVDTGATFACVPRSVLARIGVQPIGREPFSRPDGKVVECELGAVTMRMAGEERPIICVFGDDNSEPVLGMVTLEAFLLRVDPVNLTLVPVVGRLKPLAVS